MACHLVHYLEFAVLYTNIVLVLPVLPELLVVLCMFVRAVCGCFTLCLSFCSINGLLDSLPKPEKDLKRKKTKRVEDRDRDDDCCPAGITRVVALASDLKKSRKRSKKIGRERSFTDSLDEHSLEDDLCSTGAQLDEELERPWHPM